MAAPLRRRQAEQHPPPVRVRQQCDAPPELVARADWNTPLVDAVALASVISSATVGLAVAFYSANRTAKTAREGRVEQRSADGYLKILSLAEQEAQLLDSRVFNLGWDRKDLEYGVSSFLEVPKPAVTAGQERLFLSQLWLLSRYGQATRWRTAADDLNMRMAAIACGCPRLCTEPVTCCFTYVRSPA
jgi:hypothetical protein